MLAELTTTLEATLTRATSALAFAHEIQESLWHPSFAS
jgi:hypothetical protein